MKSKLLLLLVCLFLVFGAQAKTKKQDPNLKKIRSMITQQKASVQSAHAAKVKKAADLAKAQMDLATQQGIVRKMNIQYKTLKSEQTRLETKAALLESQRADLVKTIRAANTYLASSGESEIMESIILSDNVNEVTAVSQIVARVNEKLFSSVTELKKNTDDLKATSAEIKKKKIRMAQAVKDRQAAVTVYESKKKTAGQLYQSAIKDEMVKAEYLKQLQAKEKALQAKIIAAQKQFVKKAAQAKKQNTNVFTGLSTAFAQYKGKLTWPIQGHVIEKFGVKHVEGFQGVVMKKGIKIVPTSSAVHSVYDGVVIHIDNAWGLGNFLIIAHPSGFYTIYANMDSINVGMNQKVKTGQVIGTIDVDRDTNTPYLYFEIRLRDRAVDPLEWLAG